MKTRYICPLIVAAMISAMLSACMEDKWEEMELKGDISEYVPEDLLDCTAYYAPVEGDLYMLVIDPGIPESVSKWNLNVLKVDYYIDGENVRTVEKAPFICGVGRAFPHNNDNHKCKVVVTIGGKETESIVREAECDMVLVDVTNGYKPDVYWSCNYVGKGDVFEAKASLAANTPKMDVSYYWNEMFVKEQEQPPFVYTKKIDEPAGDKIKFSVSMYVPGNPINLRYWNFNKTIDVYGAEDVAYSCDIMRGRLIFRVGDMLPVEGKCYIGENRKGKVSVSMSIDEVEVATDVAVPFQSEYKIPKLTVGLHLLTCKFSYAEADSIVNTTQRFPFMVVP